MSQLHVAEKAAWANKPRLKQDPLDLFGVDEHLTTSAKANGPTPKPPASERIERLLEEGNGKLTTADDLLSAVRAWKSAAGWSQRPWPTLHPKRRLPAKYVDMQKEGLDHG
jgi:hypothetical protein